MLVLIMERGVIIVLLLLTSGLATAETICDINVTLLQQDPYPAIPGDYVELVFQLEGSDSPTCEELNFILVEDYPMVFDPGETGIRTFKKVDYLKDYESRVLIPYKVRIDENALDGANEIEILLRSGANVQEVEKFNIEIDDSRADFEVHIKEYDYKTKEMTLEILNIEESDAEALVVEIAKQDNIIIKGSNKVIVGDIDSNEYTTADFEATPSNGEITLKLTYSDAINTRRTTEKVVVFDSMYFTDRIADQKTTGTGTYVFWGALVLIIGWWGFSRFTKKKK